MGDSEELSRHLPSCSSMKGMGRVELRSGAQFDTPRHVFDQPLPKGFSLNAFASHTALGHDSTVCFAPPLNAP